MQHHHTTVDEGDSGDYRRDQLVRIAGRPYRVIKVNATVDGVDGLVLLGALTKARGGAAGEGGDLLALTPEDIDEHQAAAVAKGRTVRVGSRGREVKGKAVDSEGQSRQGQSPSATSEGQSPTEDMGISVLALLIFIAFAVAVTLLLR